MTKTPTIACTIDAPAGARLGEPVVATGTLHNTGSSGVWVLPWSTFLDGPVGNSARVRRDGHEIPYDGAGVRRRKPGPEDYVFLGAGQTRSGSIDLSKLYAIDEAGDYEVAFDLSVRLVEGSRDDPPLPDAEMERVHVASPTAQIRVAAGTAPRLTVGQRMRAEASPETDVDAIAVWTPPGSPTPPQIQGADAEMVQQIQAAWSRAYQAAVKAWKLMKASPQSDSTYATWFGAYSAPNAQKVLATFQQIIQAMSNPKKPMQVLAGTAATGCTDSRWAYAGYGSPYIGLCDGLFGSTISAWLYWTDWDDERMVSVIHEMSHVVANTTDEAGDYDTAVELAETDPAAAAANAENYGWFALAVEGSYQESGNGAWLKDTRPFSASMQGRPAATATESGGSLITAWQDGGKTSWLWANELNLAKGRWGTKSRFANPASPLKYRVTASGPALATVGSTYYLLYIDGDPNSPTCNALLCMQSSDFGAHWSAPATVVAKLGSTASPALVAGPQGQLCAVYTGTTGALASIIGTPSPDDTSVAWADPIGLGLLSALEPALGWHDGSYYLATGIGNGSVQLGVSPDFVSWKPGPQLPLTQTAAAPALVSWNAPGQTTPWLMCLYRGTGADGHLYYVVYDGTTWGVPVLEAQNLSKAAPALAAFGSTLFAFHQGMTSGQLWWSQTSSASALAASVSRAAA